MKGVKNIIREFADDYRAMEKYYKYVVEYHEDGVHITYLEKAGDDKDFTEQESIILDSSIAELLVKTVASDFDNKEVEY